jgi:curved DNA-binding protein CbpA
MPDQIDPYKILQVDSEAEDEVIQAAYRRLARKYHPDLAVTPDAAARMAAINAAWELIGEPAKRQAFDRKRAPLKTTPATTDATGTTHGAAGGAPGSGGSSAASERGGSASGGRPAGSSSSGAKPSSGSAPPAETVSRDWTSGRSTQGSGYEESMHAADGFGAAGPPPGRPSGTVLNFGRYAGWSLGEVARSDVEYIEWLDRAPIGRNYRQEIDEILRRSGRRASADAGETDRRGLFRRR